MIVVTGRIRTTPERSAQLVELAQAMCRASRGDDGCIGYRFYADTEQADHFVFIEEWRDDAALQAHFAQPHTATFMGSINALTECPPDALFHTVSSTRRLGRGGLVDA